MSEPTDDPRPKLRLLNDTVTRPFATVSGNDRWPVVTGQVRAAMPREVTAFTKAVTDAKTPDAEDRIRCEFYARHVKAWDVEGDDGQPIPVTPVTIACLPYPVWLQFEDIVTGFRGSVVVGKSDG